MIAIVVVGVLVLIPLLIVAYLRYMDNQSLEPAVPVVSPPVTPPVIPVIPPLPPPVVKPVPVVPPIPPVTLPAPRQVMAWVNESSLSPQDVARIVEALNIQSLHLLSAWPGVDVTHVVATADMVPTGAWPAYFLPSADVAGALGYHDVDPQGRPYSRVFVDTVLQNGGTVLQGMLTVASVASHEMVEMAADPTTTIWSKPRADGSLIALELGDPVEALSYDVTLADKSLVSVSDFVFPSYFDPLGKPPYDRLVHVSAPFQVLPGGYVIVKDPQGNVTQVFGERYPDWKRMTKEHPASRTFKRLHP